MNKKYEAFKEILLPLMVLIFSATIIVAIFYFTFLISLPLDFNSKSTIIMAGIVFGILTTLMVVFLQH